MKAEDRDPGQDVVSRHYRAFGAIIADIIRASHEHCNRRSLRRERLIVREWIVELGQYAPVDEFFTSSNRVLDGMLDDLRRIIACRSWLDVIESMSKFS